MYDWSPTNSWEARHRGQGEIVSDVRARVELALPRTAWTYLVAGKVVFTTFEGVAFLVNMNQSSLVRTQTWRSARVPQSLFRISPSSPGRCYDRLRVGPQLWTPSESSASLAFPLINRSTCSPLEVCSS